MKQSLQLEVMELKDKLECHKREYEKTRKVLLDVLEDVIDSIIIVLESETPLSRRENVQNLADLGGFALRIRALTDKEKANMVRGRYEPKLLRHYNDKMLADMYDYEYDNEEEHGQLATREAQYMRTGKGLHNAE